MMLKDKKRMLPTIILKKRSDGEEYMNEKPQNNGAEMAESEDLYMVADEVMEAIKNGDIRALKESLESFVECCANKESKMHSSEDSEY